MAARRGRRRNGAAGTADPSAARPPARQSALAVFGADALAASPAPANSGNRTLGPAHAGRSGASQASSSITVDAKRSAALAFDPAPGPATTQIGLGADRACDLGAQRLGPGLGLGPGHLFQRAGEDHGLAGDRAVDRRAAPRRPASSSCADQRVDRRARSAGSWKAVDDRGRPAPRRRRRWRQSSCPVRPSPIARARSSPPRTPARCRSGGQKRRRRLADMADAKREDQPVQRNCPLRPRWPRTGSSTDFSP